MLSRVAENVFWMSRYMERTNMIMRTLKYQYIAHQDDLSGMSSRDIAMRYGVDEERASNIDSVLHTIIFDMGVTSSIINNIFRSRENARSAQDNINRELWQCLNDMYHQIRDPQLQREMMYDPISVMDELIKKCMHYYGIINDSVSRSEGFYFLNMGKFVERGLQCAEILKTELAVIKNEERENPRWRYFLMSMNGYELYLSKHFGYLDTGLIVDQMLHADNYPNSLDYCWQEIGYYADRLYGKGGGDTSRALEFVIGKSYAHLKYAVSGNGAPEHILFLSEIEENFYELNNILNKCCFGLNVD